MGVRVVVKIGPDARALEPVLALMVDELVVVLEDPDAGPLVWTWQVPSGGAVQLTAAVYDTPNGAPTPGL